jgi:hypothetical protein
VSKNCFWRLLRLKEDILRVGVCEMNVDGAVEWLCDLHGQRDMELLCEKADEEVLKLDEFVPGEWWGTNVKFLPKEYKRCVEYCLGVDVKEIVLLVPKLREIYPLCINSPQFRPMQLYGSHCPISLSILEIIWYPFNCLTKHKPTDISWIHNQILAIL